jgi:Flp pilus assembly protein TadG
MKSIKAGSRGQSLVELAISLMVILLLLLGAVDFGIALYQYVAIRDAAAEGAIYGSFKPTQVNGMKFRAIESAADVTPLTDSNVDVVINGSSCQGSDSSVPPKPNSVKVTVTFDHALIFPLVSTMIGTNTIKLKADATNTILTPKCP